MERLKFNTYHKEYLPFFRNINAEPPELLTLTEIDNLETWKTLPIISKTFRLATFLDWLTDGVIQSQTNINEFEEMHKYLEYQNKEHDRINERIFRIDETLHTINGKTNKINYLKRYLADLKLWPDENDNDIIKYLQIEIDYWHNYIEDITGEGQLVTHGETFQKIKWKGTPSQFGYLFLQLVEKGYIEPPLYNGDPNFTGLSRLCFQYFDIETTPGNLTKEMTPGTPEKGNDKNTLSQTKRAKFKIPNISELA